MKKNLFLAALILSGVPILFAGKKKPPRFITQDELEEAQERACQDQVNAEEERIENSPTVKAVRAKIAKKIKALKWKERKELDLQMLKNKSF